MTVPSLKGKEPSWSVQNVLRTRDSPLPLGRVRVGLAVTNCIKLHAHTYCPLPTVHCLLPYPFSNHCSISPARLDKGAWRTVQVGSDSKKARP